MQLLVDGIASAASNPLRSRISIWPRVQNGRLLLYKFKQTSTDLGGSPERLLQVGEGNAQRCPCDLHLASSGYAGRPEQVQAPNNSFVAYPSQAGPIVAHHHQHQASRVGANDRRPDWVRPSRSVRKGG